MGSTTRTALLRYGGAVILTALAVVLRLLLDPLLGEHLPFITLFAAVGFVAWYGGRGPALLALLAGALGVTVFVLQPRYSFAVAQPEYQVGLLLYGVVGL